MWKGVGGRDNETVACVLGGVEVVEGEDGKQMKGRWRWS